MLQEMLVLLFRTINLLLPLAEIKDLGIEDMCANS